MRIDPPRGALGQRHEPIGNGGGTTPRGAAGVLAQVERVARDAEKVVVGNPPKAHDRAVGLAKDDGTAALFNSSVNAHAKFGLKSLRARIPPKVVGDRA